MSEDGLEIWRSGQQSGVGPVDPEVPAIVLHYPKYPHNVGQIVRLASCYGIRQVWFSGNRVSVRNGKAEQRLPREERMRGYQDVTLISHPDPLARILEAHPHIRPVAVELRPGSEHLPWFEHPDPGDAVYVFGPEDGSLPGPMLKRCHRFVTIPSFQCLNLSTSVATVLYDRMQKLPSHQWPRVKDRGVAA